MKPGPIRIGNLEVDPRDIVSITEVSADALEVVLRPGARVVGREGANCRSRREGAINDRRNPGDET